MQVVAKSREYAGQPAGFDYEHGRPKQRSSNKHQGAGKEQTRPAPSPTRPRPQRQQDEGKFGTEAAPQSQHERGKIEVPSFAFQNPPATVGQHNGEQGQV